MQKASSKLKAEKLAWKRMRILADDKERN